MTDIEGRVVLSLTGELEDPEMVRAAIDDASRSFTRPLQVDLTAVTYLPSVVIGVLFAAQGSAAAAGVALEVVVAEGTVVHSVVRITAMPHTAVPDRLDP